MACGGCMQKYPGYVRTTTASSAQPKVQQTGRYVVRPTAPMQQQPVISIPAFPLSTKK